MDDETLKVYGYVISSSYRERSVKSLNESNSSNKYILSFSIVKFKGYALLPKVNLTMSHYSLITIINRYIFIIIWIHLITINTYVINNQFFGSCFFDCYVICSPLINSFNFYLIH